MGKPPVPVDEHKYTKLSETFHFDEQGFINETLQVLKELHGSYTLRDVDLVRKLAALERDAARAEDRLRENDTHLLTKTAANGYCPSAYFTIRDKCLQSILKIRQDLQLDIKTRKTHKSAEAAEESFFSVTARDKEAVFATQHR